MERVCFDVKPDQQPADAPQFIAGARTGLKTWEAIKMAKFLTLWGTDTTSI